MENYQQELEKEQQYLEKTESVIRNNLQQERSADASSQESLIEAKRELWENANAGKLQDANQYIESIQMKASAQYAASQRVSQYEKALDCPYFARIDFKEEGFGTEKVYIGLHGVTDDETYETYVYDWRAPVASMFYRYEPGAASYPAPIGTISGEITLKRQYEIKKSQLRYFFDSNVNIQDEILKNVLSQNASPTMKSIVETIQRQQDMIIRDSENELLIVQGVAGSGKTSVALHRVAYLMYQGLAQRLSAQNITIISPNPLFGKYIANVLPELGEENISSVTFEDIFHRSAAWNGRVKTKTELMETLTSSPDLEKSQLLRDSLEFFTSSVFRELLERYLRYFRREMIPFTDVYYNNIMIATRQEMKAFLHSSNRTVSTENALRLIEKRLWDKIHQERKKRLKKLARFFAAFNEHRYDYPAYSRYVSVLESTRLKRQIAAFTTINCQEAYKKLITNAPLFYKLAQSLALPKNIEEIRRHSARQMNQGILECGDSLGLLYLKTRLAGLNFPDIKQVVVDEAQDYFPLYFYILRELFPNARYTVIGDVNQTMEKEASLESYLEIQRILDKKTSSIVYLNKGFRCSYEISQYSDRFLATAFPTEQFERHDKEPEVFSAVDTPQLDQMVVEAVNACCKEGFSSIAVICKTADQAAAFANRVRDRLDITCLTSHDRSIRGIVALPVYLAKGLEFDAAMIYEVNEEQYHTSFHKKLLYICSTRPLHRLYFFHTGKLSPLFNL